MPNEPKTTPSKPRDKGNGPHGRAEVEVGKHVHVVTYRIADISEAEFIEANKEFAEMVAAVSSREAVAARR